MTNGHDPLSRRLKNDPASVVVELAQRIGVEKLKKLMATVMPPLAFTPSVAAYFSPSQENLIRDLVFELAGEALGRDDLEDDEKERIERDVGKFEEMYSEILADDACKKASALEAIECALKIGLAARLSPENVLDMRRSGANNARKAKAEKLASDPAEIALMEAIDSLGPFSNPILHNWTLAAKIRDRVNKSLGDKGYPPVSKDKIARCLASRE